MQHTFLKTSSFQYTKLFQSFLLSCLVISPSLCSNQYEKQRPKVENKFICKCSVMDFSEANSVGITLTKLRMISTTFYTHLHNHNIPWIVSYRLRQIFPP
ncbi:UNVERIFIED_CONTAM: hypothetical protein K2H54_059999 [Gekko kuhli]